MSDKYKIRDKDKAYQPDGKAGFITMTIIDPVRADMLSGRYNKRI